MSRVPLGESYSFKGVYFLGPDRYSATAERLPGMSLKNLVHEDA